MERTLSRTQTMLVAAVVVLTVAALGPTIAGAATPLASVSVDGPDTTSDPGSLTIDYSVENTGSSDRGYILETDVPDNYTIQSTSGPGTWATDNESVAIHEIAAGETADVSVEYSLNGTVVNGATFEGTVKARDSGAIETESDSHTVDWGWNVSVDAPDGVEPGEETTVVVEYHHPDGNQHLYRPSFALSNGWTIEDDNLTNACPSAPGVCFNEGGDADNETKVVGYNVSVPAGATSDAVAQAEMVPGAPGYCPGASCRDDVYGTVIATDTIGVDTSTPTPTPSATPTPDDGGDDGDGGSDSAGTPSISVADISVNGTPAPGETVTVTVELVNDGDGDGSIEVPFTVNGEDVNSRSVFVNAGDSTSTSYTYTLDEEGEYEFASHGASTTIDAQEDSTPLPTDTATPTPTDTPTPTETPESGGAETPADDGGGFVLPLLLLLVVVAAIGGGYYYYENEME